ncbi:MAG TPA: globin [Tepidisphaeraceae bacterium]|jgi:hemoglobin|nr:globin [Tepidisphaeraceae bacterium]
MLDTAIYEAIGEEGFARLVRAFYTQVPGDEILGPMYPKEDLAGAEERLRDFLVQRFGGPERYMERRGHPRLRMRHAPFVVDQKGRDRWLKLMEAAFAEAGLPVEVEGVLRSFFEVAGTHMINVD